uniref:Uncharacterized protein n=1 Tax=viral metagenome TaxID=1070528 RepID=A0A6C0J9K2_9ZZZZ
MIKLLLISSIESAYLIYMFNYFKTKFVFNHPMLSYLKDIDYFKHPISRSNISIRPICKFGQDVSLFFLVYFILRNILVYTKNIKILIYVNSFVIGITFILSFFMNPNAFVYLIPIFLIEYYYTIKLRNFIEE